MKLWSVHIFFQSVFTGNISFGKYIDLSSSSKRSIKYPTINCSLTCPAANQLGGVTDRKPAKTKTICPNYFRWIHEDLKYWKKTGITKEMVVQGKDKAHFRLVIVNGTHVYLKKYDKPIFQTRDVFTLWGIMQLLRLYPGQLPDLDLMFECGDKPKILKNEYGSTHGSKANSKIVPPVFHYCGDDSSFDIVFPDWSFWGW